MITAELPTCQPPHPNPRPPRLTLPPNATDCHVHVYGPESLYPVAATAHFRAPDALPATLNDLHRVLGVARTVLIQPSTYGTDNSRHLDALRELGRPSRFIATAPFDAASDHLRRLKEAGACGMRAAVGHPGGPSFDEIRRFADKLAPHGLHLEFHVRREPGDMSVLTRAGTALRNLPVDLTIAHFASLEPDRGLAQADVDALCDLLGSGRLWIKLSAGYRTSAAPPYADLTPFAQAFVAARPDRILWGTDWPHVGFAGTMPNTTDQLDCLLEWVPDGATRNRILVDNPQALYKF